MTDNRKHTSFLSKAGKYVLRGFTAIGIMVFIGFVFMMISLNSLGKMKPQAPQSNTVLTYTFENSLPETPLPPSLARPLLSSQLRLHDLIKTLDHAATDPAITGFIARIKPNSLSIAQTQELREAVIRFQAEGKFAHVFATAFGDFTNGMKDYYLASAFGEIWLQPIGNVSITGLTGQLPFFKETLDKLGVTADMMARADYKTAVEPMTRNTPSPQNDEMTQRLLSTLNTQMIDGMANARQLPPSAVRLLVDRAPLTAEQALDANLVDHIGYVDQMIDVAREKSGGEDTARFWEADLYYSYLQDQHTTSLKEKYQNRRLSSADESDEDADVPRTRVALIFANGAIMPGDTSDVSYAAPLTGGPVLSAEKISAAIHQARRDPRVGAIVIRLDSPGGSATASETIARAVDKAQMDDKPVFISMSTAAASGGYWISAKASKIIAQPATLTGSIGVLGGKIAIGELLDKIGVNIVEYNFGENGGMWSSTDRFSPSERAKVNNLLDHTYNEFLKRVSEGRSIPLERLRNDMAGGRVWTGAEAMNIGLVDELGGLNTATRLAQMHVNAETPDSIDIVEYPPVKSPVEAIIDLLVNGAPMQIPVATVLWNRMMESLMVLNVPNAAYANLPAFK